MLNQALLAFRGARRQQQAALIPRDEVERALVRLCAPPLPSGKNGPQPCITDECFQHIASLLKHLERHLKENGWSSRPRTYAVLRSIGRADLMPAFIALDLKDYSFPYSVEKLPEVFSDDSIKESFMNAQKYVLTQAVSLENGAEGVHAHTKNGEDLYYAINHLGSGGYGSVDHVWSRLSFKHYARKRFMRPKNSRDDQQLLRKFDQEISSLKRLSHQHLVTMIGSYTDQRSVAYLMEPVAECNLYTYLCQPRTFIDQRSPSLRSYFGCLASAVAYLHRQRVRHRDLKPQNILVWHHDVFITDFGTALDWSKRGRDTTNDPSTPVTEQYMAPEFARRSGSSRSSASDIWSLGVVFLEMVSVLRGCALRELYSFLETHGTKHPFVWNNTSAVTNQWFKKLRENDVGPESDNEPMIWIKDMLQFSPGNRPSSGALTKQIRSAAAFIGNCCKTDDDLEDYHSPPSSSHSEEDIELLLDDMPPELELGERPFGSLIEASRQSSIERWLGVGPTENDFISDATVEPPDILEADPTDLPYDIVDDSSTLTTMIPDQDSTTTESIEIDTFKTLESCEGYDIVQDDSDEETLSSSQGRGYEVMEDSSGSEATIRQALTQKPKTTVHSYDILEKKNAVDRNGDSRSIPSTVIQEIEIQLDKLEIPAGKSIRQGPTQRRLTSGGLESLNSANSARQPQSVNTPVPRGQQRQKKEENMAGIIGEESSGQGERQREPREVDKATITVEEAPVQKKQKRKPREANGPGVMGEETSVHREQHRPPTMAEIAGITGEEKTVPEKQRRQPTEANVARTVEEETAVQRAQRRQQREANMAKMMGEEPQISPSVYMQEVWEAASSAATSTMSETTRRTIGGFGSGLAWQDKTAHILEKYVKLGKAAAVRELLQAGCNPGTREKPRIRPLILGVKGGSQRHNKCVAALLSAGADVNACGWSGRTPLHYAIEHQAFPGYTNLIRDLLEAGADPNKKAKSGDFPLLQILDGGYEPLEKHKRDALACLLQNAFATDVNVAHPGTQDTPLHLAVRRKDPWAVSMLLTQGARINKTNGSGFTPLMLAANGWTMKMSAGQNKVLQFLLDGRAKVNECNELGKTALHSAAHNLCERAVGLLLERGADPNIKDNEGNLASHCAEDPSNKKKAPEAYAAIMEMLSDATANP